VYGLRLKGGRKGLAFGFRCSAHGETDGYRALRNGIGYKV